MKLAAEDYVRPVTGSSEPRGERSAVWRFRVVALVVLLLLAVGVVYLVRAISGEFDGNPVPTNGGTVGAAVVRVALAS